MASPSREDLVFTAERYYVEQVLEQPADKQSLDVCEESSQDEEVQAPVQPLLGVEQVVEPDDKQSLEGSSEDEEVEAPVQPLLGAEPELDMFARPPDHDGAGAAAGNRKNGKKFRPAMKVSSMRRSGIID